MSQFFSLCLNVKALFGNDTTEIFLPLKALIFQFQQGFCPALGTVLQGFIQDPVGAFRGTGYRVGNQQGQTVHLGFHHHQGEVPPSRRGE